MRLVLKESNFARWARKAHLADEALCEAVAEIVRGLIDADLGGGVLKQRVALGNRGKSAGARVYALSDKRSRWLFIEGYKKNERTTSPTRN